jgi:death-on-curing protein
MQSAVARAQMGYYQNALEEAAALLESLVMNHPFIDGNKRTGWFCFDVYMRYHEMNITYRISDQQIHNWMVEFMSSNWFDFRNILGWIRSAWYRL